MIRPALDADALRSFLAGSALGSKILVHESIDSTNDAIRTLAGSGASHGTVVYAEEQSSGRGRRSARWHAPPGSALLHSILLEPCWPVQQLGRIPLVAGLAVTRAVEQVAPDLAPSIKWPNDLWLGSRKFCGILAESEEITGRTIVILGIGVNVLATEEELHPEIRTTATSLAMESEGGQFASSREALAVAILQHLEVLLEEVARGFHALSEKIERRLLWHGESVTCLEGTETTAGRIAGLGPSGELLLDTPDGRRALVHAAELRPLS